MKTPFVSTLSADDLVEKGRQALAEARTSEVPAKHDDPIRPAKIDRSKSSESHAAAEGSWTLFDLFVDTVRDVYYAETRILAVLPRIAQAAQSDVLRQHIQSGIPETEEQLVRIVNIFEAIDVSAWKRVCEAIDGIIAEIEEALTAFDGSPVLDAAIVSGLQAMCHYEIARYGTLASWARQLDNAFAAEMFTSALKECSARDRFLTSLASPADARSVNRVA